MYSATNKFTVIVAVAVLAASAFGSFSCDSAAKREKASADSLLSAAKEMIAVGQYEEAFAAIDSLNKRFPAQIEARREAMNVQAAAMIEYSQQQLIVTDSIIAVLESQLAPFEPKMRHIGGDDIAGYFVADNVYNKDFLSSTSIEGRVDDEDLSFYIVALNNKKHIGINSLIFNTAVGLQSSAVLDVSSERSGDIDPNGIDLATFTADDLSNILNVLESSPLPAISTTVTLKGKKGEAVDVALSPAQVQAIIDTYHFSDLASRLQQARWMHDKYERQLIISRDHTANLQE